jgi:threonine dehydratase
MCMFYQTKTNRMIFVSNKEGVFQSEATANYDSEKKARNVVDDSIAGSVKNGFAVDTVSVNDFELYKKGVKAVLQVSENKITKNFDVSVKANKSED